MTKNRKIDGFMQYTDVGVRHQMGPQAQALHLRASPLPAQAAWALASSQPDLLTLLLLVGDTCPTLQLHYAQTVAGQVA